MLFILIDQIQYFYKKGLMDLHEFFQLILLSSQIW